MNNLREKAESIIRECADSNSQWIAGRLLREVLPLIPAEPFTIVTESELLKCFQGEKLYSTLARELMAQIHPPKPKRKRWVFEETGETATELKAMHWYAEGHLIFQATIDRPSHGRVFKVLKPTVEEIE